MARNPTKQPKPKDSKPADKDTPKVHSVEGLNTADLVAQLDTWIGESKTEWDSDKYKLTEITKENEELYYGWQVSRSDEEDDGKSLDNRIFSAVQTIVPFVTNRITEPEVYPSSNSEEAKKFADDFEKALHIKADREQFALKAEFAIEDAIIKRRGYWKPRYDAATQNFCSMEYVPCEAIIIDHVSMMYEEPRYFRHLLKKSVDDLLTMFPGMEKRIKEIFKIEANTPKSEYKELHTINEDWAFVTLDGQRDLVVCWNYNKEAFGVIKDPNWRYDGQNFLSQHMMPLVFFNVLSDGRTHIDKTTHVEQAKYAQLTIDKRGEQIGKNAGLGSIGMPVVSSGSIADDQAQYLQYEEDTVLELEVPEGKGINDVFTKWQANPLSPDVYKDKLDAIEAVNNAFGASAINQGTESNNKTLGQDELLRDQSNGRQQKIIKAMDRAMGRAYQLTAQFMLVYGTEEELFEFVGENSTFDYIIMNSSELDTKATIRVKAGTSMPVDNPQRRATADKAAGAAMIDPLSYWEIMDEPNAQKIAKRLVDYTMAPDLFMQDTQEEIFNRDAYTDIQLIIKGKPVPYRESLDKEYFDYLNQYILSGNLENPKIPPEAAQTVSSFIDTQLQRGQKMLGMLETQLPTAEDVNAHNQQVDSANTANVDATKGIPKPPAGGSMNKQPAKKPQGAAK